MKGGSEETAQTNIAYTCNGSVFEAGSPYYFQDRDAVTFNAYYPYDENLADNRRIGINTRAENQTVETVNENSWDKNDYLFATKETTVSTPEISFTEDEGNPFRHVMSKFTLTLKAGDGITNLNALTGYILHDVIVDGYFDVTTGRASLDEGETKEDIEMTVTSPTGKTVTCEPLILLPQSINLPLSLTVHYNDQKYTAKLQLPEETKDELAAGYHYKYTVKVSNTELEITNTSIEKWTEKENDGEATLK